jgi:hypothetical protein
MASSLCQLTENSELFLGFGPQIVRQISSTQRFHPQVQPFRRSTMELDLQIACSEQILTLKIESTTALKLKACNASAEAVPSAATK